MVVENLRATCTFQPGFNDLARLSEPTLCIWTVTSDSNAEAGVTHHLLTVVVGMLEHGLVSHSRVEDLAHLFALGGIIIAENVSVHRERSFKTGAEKFFRKPIENVQSLAKIKKTVGG
jgi:hypothetical protein